MIIHVNSTLPSAIFMNRDVRQSNLQHRENDLFAVACDLHSVFLLTTRFVPLPSPRSVPFEAITCLRADARHRAAPVTFPAPFSPPRYDRLKFRLKK